MGIEFRSDLNGKIIEVVSKKELTHADVAHLAHTSRTRATAILNRNTHDISTDLMLRVLGSLGVRAKLQFQDRRLRTVQTSTLHANHLIRSLLQISSDCFPVKALNNDKNAM
jgi:hypothetical protein